MAANNPNGRLTLKDAILIVAVSGVTMLNVFLQGALTVALPTIGKDLNFKQSSLQWPVNVYSLSFGCSVLFFGRVGDILGGKTMFLAGSLWFGVWSLASSFAPNDTAFIIFMALKGLGAAANTPAGIGLFASYFPPGSKRNKAFGMLGAGQPIGFIVGLVVGGILADSKATWRSIFYIQTGLALSLSISGWFVLPHQPSAHRYTKGLDYGGVALSTAGIAILTYSLADSTTARKGWSTPQIPSLFSVSFVILAAFIYYEQQREAANKSVLMPLRIWSKPGARMATVMGIVFFSMWSFNALSYFATLFYQQVELLSPIQTSLRFIPMAISGFLINVIVSFAVRKMSGHTLMVMGLLGLIAATLIFSLIDLRASYWAMAFLVMILPVLGVDVVYPVGNLQLTSFFDEDSMSLAGAIFTVASRIGTSLGLAVSSSIATAISSKYAASHPQLAPNSPEVLMVGFRAAGWSSVATAIIAFVWAAIGLRGIGIVGQKRLVDEKPIELDNRLAVARTGEQVENTAASTPVAALSQATSLRSLTMGDEKITAESAKDSLV